jgi:demethylmenaquinone methyltransferase/2-methoxy-6-polyprenyl-1,4-benzoquinol methylase
MTSWIASGELAPDAVRAMFDRIAPIYDWMNRLMTAGLDRRWREMIARRVVRDGDAVLDAACGTGDLALADLRAGAVQVVGVDFSERMLERARRKSNAVEWVRADLRRLPFSDGSFHVVTIGFGLRNVPDPEETLRELRRVLAPGGRIGVLEITRPRGLAAPFFRIWFDGLVPLAGRLLPGGSAYSYLPASVRRFPPPEELAGQMTRSGFGKVRYQLLAGGIVALHVGVAS